MTHEHFATTTRIGRIKNARGKSLEEIYCVTHSLIEQDDKND